MKLLSVYLYLIFISGCASFPDTYSLPAEVYIDGDTLVYKGSIDARPVLRALRLADKEVKVLIIQSGGGDVESGIEFGYWVHNNDIKVVVDGLCFSSCANYILTASNDVLIKSNSVIGWHGGAYQDFGVNNHKWYEYLSPSRMNRKEKFLGSMIDYLRKKETEFFEYIGVDPEITTYGQTEDASCQRNSESAGWFYGLSDLKHMGVGDIQLEDGHFNMRSDLFDITVCEMPRLFNT